jgi:hypothetical protein
MDTVKKLTMFVLACAFVAGCGSKEPPHSNYFVLTFVPGAPKLSGPGLEALQNAADQAGKSTPRFIAVSASLPPAGAATTLAEERLAAISEALAKAGVDPHLIRTDLTPADAKTFEASQDSFIVQLGYGDLPPP